MAKRLFVFHIPVAKKDKSQEECEDKEICANQAGKDLALFIAYVCSDYWVTVYKNQYEELFHALEGSYVDVMRRDLGRDDAETCSIIQCGKYLKENIWIISPVFQNGISSDSPFRLAGYTIIDKETSCERREFLNRLLECEKQYRDNRTNLNSAIHVLKEKKKEEEKNIVIHVQSVVKEVEKLQKVTNTPEAIQTLGEVLLGTRKLLSSVLHRDDIHSYKNLIQKVQGRSGEWKVLGIAMVVLGVAIVGGLAFFGMSVTTGISGMAYIGCGVSALSGVGFFCRGWKQGRLSSKMNELLGEVVNQSHRKRLS